MGKYIGYAILVFIILFVLNLFKIIDIPFLDVPDFTAQKANTMQQRDQAVRDID
jgi:hypothetical protein